MYVQYQMDSRREVVVKIEPAEDQVEPAEEQIEDPEPPSPVTPLYSDLSDDHSDSTECSDSTIQRLHDIAKEVLEAETENQRLWCELLSHKAVERKDDLWDELLSFAEEALEQVEPELCKEQRVKIEPAELCKLRCFAHEMMYQLPE